MRTNQVQTNRIANDVSQGLKATLAWYIANSSQSGAREKAVERARNLLERNFERLAKHAFMSRVSKFLPNPKTIDLSSLKDSLVEESLTSFQELLTLAKNV